MIGQAVWDERIRYWNTTPAERAPDHPADRAQPAPGAEHFVRAIDVEADPGTVYRWLCQIKVAPYSYDLIDNLGRRSPRTLTPGVDELALGQRFAIGPIVDFEPGVQITVATAPRWSRLFGTVTMSWQVTPGVAARSRIVACLCVGRTRHASAVRHALLGAGDLPMMRKQLLTLRDLAEGR